MKTQEQAFKTKFDYEQVMLPVLKMSEKPQGELF